MKCYLFTERFYIYIQTYIDNWLLQPLRQDYDRVSHTTYGVWVSFYICVAWSTVCTAQSGLKLNKFTKSNGLPMSDMIHTGSIKS